MAKKTSKTRRKNGEGSIYQQKNGLWTGKIWVENPATGERKRKTVYGKSRTEIAKKLVEISGSMTPLNSKEFRNKSFGDLFEEWLLVFKKSAVAPRTFETNIMHFRKYIKPFVGNMNIGEVTAPVVQQVINEALIKRNAINTAKKLKILFNQFFEYAIDTGFVEANPTARIKIRNRNINYESRENIYKAIPKDERMRFIEALNEHEFLKPLCMTMMFAGLRVGEVLAVRWENVDFDNKTISVKSGVIRIPFFDDKGRTLYKKTFIGNTKTACSVREIPVPDILIDSLKDWRKCQWVRKQLTGVDLLAENAIVFGNKDGTVRTVSGTRRIFDRWKKRVGLNNKKLHFHMLRHTYSNMLFEMGENPKVIQMLLGHKSVKTTLTVYNSIDTSYYKEATEKLNKLFNAEKMQEYREFEKKKDIPALKRSEEEIENKYDDPEIEFLEKMLAERKAKMKNQKDDFDMW